MSSSKIEEVGEARRSMNAICGVMGGEFTVYSLLQNFMTNRRNYVLVFFCQKNRTEEQKDKILRVRKSAFMFLCSSVKKNPTEEQKDKILRVRKSAFMFLCSSVKKQSPPR